MRLSIAKTYKLFIGGKFPRTESGRYLTAKSNRGRHLANYCHASKKDFRDAVVAARKACAGWQGASAYLRSQIIYRIGEMLEGRASAFAEELAVSTGCSEKDALAEVQTTIDRLIHYAGWADKYGPLFSTVNPVASPHFNFSFQEPTGVVTAIAPDKPALLAAATMIAAAIVSGNTVILVTSDRFPLPLLSLAEVIATSDVPGGVVNILAGQRSELAPHIASHMDVNAISDGTGSPEIRTILQEGSAANMKRFSAWNLTEREWWGTKAEDPYRILDTVETKTAWHPMGV
ncbi:MAG: acyl-CoA reductase-like NAD-dependent aldehyde dehydrogenase [Verrucomicrobiales bacterium]|jgi:acyl-CoA reductase-like NAD-dependent aldehyde dehydrogenase